MNNDSDVSILGLFFFVAFIFLLYEAWSTKAYIITIQHDVEILKLSHCYADTPVTTNVKEK
jgi:hypothetical protein